jgi:hypothetical protein
MCLGDRHHTSVKSPGKARHQLMGGHEPITGILSDREAHPVARQVGKTIQESLRERQVGILPLPQEQALLGEHRSQVEPIHLLDAGEQSCRFSPAGPG